MGHVTKDGSLAGPKALEHIVDTVLYFEGEHHHAHRIVRAVKNRFGAVSELGVFEMTSEGLRPVANPSALFLAERPVAVPGSAVVCSIEGSRPILVEVQALVSGSSYGTARRMAIGIDPNRLSLLLAVLEKRAGLNLAGEDVFVNVAGGLTIDEPAVDLAVVAAVSSSARNRPVGSRTAVFGEVGLAGEVRAVTQAARRAREAAQMGFERVVLPAGNLATPDTTPPGCALVGVGRLDDGARRSCSAEARPGCGDRPVTIAAPVVSVGSFAELHGGTRMGWFILARVLFVVTVAWVAAQIGPVPGGWIVNLACGVGVAGVIVLAETRLHDVGLPQLLGALLGGAAGLGIAKTIESALFWANDVRPAGGVPSRRGRAGAALRRHDDRGPQGRVARTGAARRALQGDRARPPVQDSRHERHHRRTDRRRV